MIGPALSLSQVAATVALTSAGAYAWHRSLTCSPCTVAARPLPISADDLHHAALAQIDAGVRDPCVVAANLGAVACRCPGQAHGIAPPDPDAPREIHERYAAVLEAVDEAFGARGLDTGGLVAPGPGARWANVVLGPRSRDLPRYPWADPILHEEPIPSAFYWTKDGDTDAEVFRKLLANALAMAGVDAAAYGADPGVERRLRRDLRELVLLTPFNDRRLTSESAALAGGRDPGTNGPNDPGALHVLGPHGRGLVWACVHEDDASRLAHGLPARRNVDLHGQPLGSARCGMLIYFAAINLAALRGPDPQITTDGMTWPDGTNTICPPPVIEALGVDEGTEPTTPGEAQP